MRRMVWSACRSWLAVASVLLPTVALAAAPDVAAPDVVATGTDVLDVVPADALGLVVIPNLADSNARVESLGQKALLPVPAPLDFVKGMLQITSGLDEDRGAAIASLAAEDGSRARVIFVPTSNFKRLVRQLQPEDMLADPIDVVVGGQRMYVTERNDYAVFTLPAHKKLLRSIVESKKSIAAQLKPLADWTSQQHTYAVITPQGIASGVKEIGDGFKQAETEFAELGLKPEDVQPMFGIYKQLLDGAEGEISHLAAGLRIDDDANLYINARALLRSGGMLADAFNELPAPKHDLLSRLPNQSFVVAGGAFTPEAWSRQITEWSMELLRVGVKMSGEGELTKAQARQIRDSMRLLASGVERVSVFFGQSEGDEVSFYGQRIDVLEVDDAKKYLENHAQAYRQMDAVAKEIKVAQAPTHQVNLLEIDGRTVLEIIQEEPAEEAPLEEAPAEEGDGLEENAFGLPLGGFDLSAQRFEEILGTGGPRQQYLTAADDGTVVVVHEKDDIEAAVKAATAGGPGLAQHKQIKHTAGLLPKQPTFVGYLDPGGLVRFLDRAVATALGDQAIPIPPFPESPPIGVAVTVTSQHIDKQLVLPVEVLQGTTQYIPLLLFAMPLPMMQGGQLPLE